MVGKGSLGPRLLGATCSLLVFGVFVLGLVEVGLTLTGVAGAGHDVFESAARRLKSGADEHRELREWDDEWEDDDWEETSSEAEQWKILSHLIQLGLMVVICIAECLALLCHWNLFIRPKPNLYIPARPVVPQDLKGSFKYDLFDCFGACGTFCCFTWCGPCMVADLWYRAGWLHAALGSMAQGSDTGSCPGWPFFAGVGAYCIAQDAIGCCMPCAFAVLRGGIGFVDGGDGGLGEITPHRKLFEIPHDGAGTFCMDTLTWCCCGACAGTQEYRQIMDLLNRGPIQQMPMQHPQVIASVVGQPVQVGQVVQVGQPIQSGGETSNNKGV
mmetsp:Transcript_146903/g.372810  ORF Transcript_146903/g.372810 Transcript_146903/m.372810 type:complete len:328 (-) Transcript_146903:175-1158(-)